MIPAADVERAVDDEEAQLVGRRPGHVVRLAACAGLGLINRAFDRDDDVAEVRAPAWRQPKGRSGRSIGGLVEATLMRRISLRLQQREGQHVGRPRVAQVGNVQLGQLGIAREDQADRGWRWRTGRIERGGDRPREGSDRDDVRDARPDGDVDAPRGSVDADRPLRRRRRLPPRDATRARRPCSAGRRSAGGTSRGAG